MSRGKISTEERIKAIEKYKAGKGSYESIAKEYGISKRTLVDLVAIYDSQGIEAFYDTRRNHKYTKELKQEAVQEYLTGKYSQQEICKRFKIRQRSQLRSWIKMYNGQKGLKESHGSGTEIYMTKGRKTTQQERAEIVAFCMEHGKDYSLTIQTYEVSYQQIYSWVRKYEASGVNGLVDGRGRTKPKSEMTETEKLKAENRILQSQLKDQEMIIAFLKKLKELEEGGR
jgi:transposase-like protein